MAKPAKKMHSIKAIKHNKVSHANNKIQKPHKASGVPRHEFSVAKQGQLSTMHKDATRDSVTAFLQPFLAYQERLQPGLPVVGDNQALYGFWTRNVIQVTDVAFAAGPNAGSWVAIRPWLTNQLTTATAYSDVIGTPNAFVGSNDPFNAACVANFEYMACGYQGVRVKNLTPVLSQGGESLLARSTHDTVVSSYAAARVSGTSFIKSAADPGVMMQMAYQGLTGMVPAVAGTIVDYGLLSPTVTIYDGKSSTLLFRSQSGAANPQTWEIEVVTCYLARPFSNTSVFFAPTKHEVDMMKFDRLVDRAEAATPEYSVARVAMKDDGQNPTILSDLQTIWNGAAAVGRVATAAWTGLTSLFGLQAEQRHLRALAFINDDDDLKEFTDSLGPNLDETVARLTALAAPKASVVTRVDYEALLRRLDELELKEAKEWEKIPESNTQLRINPTAGQKLRF